MKMQLMRLLIKVLFGQRMNDNTTNPIKGVLILELYISNLVYLKKLTDSSKTFTLNELNLQTFNVFYFNNEVENIIIINKRLFIEKSPVWNYKDLLYATKNSNKWFKSEFNTKLIDESLFIIALSRILWADDEKYTEPLITHMNKQINGVIDQIFDTDDKIIILPGNQKSIIAQVGYKLYFVSY